jgi:hypothetical protein
MVEEEREDGKMGTYEDKVDWKAEEGVKWVEGGEGRGQGCLEDKGDVGREGNGL